MFDFYDRNRANFADILALLTVIYAALVNGYALAIVMSFCYVAGRVVGSLDKS